MADEKPSKNEAPTEPTAEPPAAEQAKTDNQPPKEFVAPREEIKPAAEFEAVPAQPPVAEKPQIGHWARLRHWYFAKKWLSIPLSVGLLVLFLLAIPQTRYPLASAVGVKQSVSLQVLDSKTNTPVSGASVQAGSLSALTDNSGKATIGKLAVGKTTLKITKKYYQDGSLSLTVPIFKAKATPSVNLVATGRQVKVIVTNFVGKKPLSKVQVKFAETTAQTGSDGVATVVLPAGVPSQKATISLDGFNSQNVDVKVSDQTVAENKYSLVPAGKIYFLSNRTGKVNVMKSDLDGGNATVVLAGTGSEDVHNTVIATSDDHKYVALLSRRSGTASPQLYIISTNTDKTAQIDADNAAITLDGWLGDYLIYHSASNDLTFQAGRNKLKSYNATNGQTINLDQSTSVGDANAYGYESYVNVFLEGSSVLFAKNWYAYWNPYAEVTKIDLSGKANTLILINPDGTHRSQVASFNDQTNLPSYTAYAPGSVYIWQRTGVENSFLSYTFGGAPKSVNITPDDFYKQYPSYQLSPSNKQSFWSEQRDGKNTLFVGDATGGNAKEIASASDYAAYGWYNDQYLLVSKTNSELYIMSVNGGEAAKITNYLQASGYGF